MPLPKKTPEPLSGSYHISQDGDIITASIQGKMTAQVVRGIAAALTEAANKLRAQGKRPVAFIDASTLKFSDSESGGRTEGRRLIPDIPVEGVAVYGRAHIGMLVEYIGRALGMGDKLRYFSDKRSALSWLRGETKPQQPRSSVGLVVGIIVALIGAVTLFGWQTGNPYILNQFAHLRPMNPVAAVGLVTLGVAFFCYWRGAYRLLRLLGWVGVGLGVAALLPLNIDTVLYGDTLRAIGAHTELADSAAVCFILSGILGLLAGRDEKWVQPTQYAAAALMGAIAAVNLYGQLYARDVVYGISGSFVMAFSLSCAFLITATAMVILILLRSSRGALQRVTRSGWLIVIALVFVQCVTYLSWAQAKERNTTEASQAFLAKAKDINEEVNVRLQAYVGALRGFRGLFAASTNVSQGDFEAYYASLDLAKTYPGLRTIAFISAVRTADLPAFVAERRADNSLVPGGHPQFTIQNQTAEPLHFIATYVAGTATSPSFGNDVTSVPGRSAIYNAALQADGNYSSGTITFPASATAPAAEGFFIATPVSTAESPSPIGVVSANFNYSDFFGSIINSSIEDKDLNSLAISVRDSADGEPIYESGQKLDGTDLLTNKITVSLAQNQSWEVQVQAPANFGISANQIRLSNFVVWSGQLFTILLVGIFVLQIRARGRALALADTVTEDLQIERDNIAALHKKDEAILAGIGEGLIVVDRFGKIEITNAAAARLFGLNQQDMIGKNVLTVARATDEKGQPIPDEKRPFVLSLQQKKIITATINYIRNDGRQFPAKVTVAPILLRDQLIGTIEVFSDISRERQLEHMKDEFLSVASHELRTPMGAIRANLSMILSGDYGRVNKGLVEPLTDMKDSTVRLVELVSDLLNVARIEAGRMLFTLTHVGIADITRSVVASLAPLGKEKGVRIALAAQSANAQVQADVDKIKQVLTNLIGNSLKFTDKGSIIIDVQPHKDVVEVTVTDTGIGITPDDQSKLFSKFKQITSAQAGKPAGTGLGLYVSREMVRKMGGDMWIKSSVAGKGSTFAFTIPVVGSAAAAKAKQGLDREAHIQPDQK